MREEGEEEEEEKCGRPEEDSKHFDFDCLLHAVRRRSGGRAGGRIAGGGASYLIVVCCGRQICVEGRSRARPWMIVIMARSWDGRGGRCRLPAVGLGGVLGVKNESKYVVRKQAKSERQRHYCLDDDANNERRYGWDNERRGVLLKPLQERIRAG